MFDGRMHGTSVLIVQAPFTAENGICGEWNQIPAWCLAPVAVNLVAGRAIVPVKDFRNLTQVPPIVNHATKPFLHGIANLTPLSAVVRAGLMQASF